MSVGFGHFEIFWAISMSFIGDADRNHNQALRILEND
jgi:hypothetical protein